MVYSKHLLCFSIPIWHRFNSKDSLSSQQQKQKLRLITKPRGISATADPKTSTTTTAKSRLNCGVPKLLPMALPFYGKQPGNARLFLVHQRYSFSQPGLCSNLRSLEAARRKLQQLVRGSLNVFFRRLRDWPYSSQRTSWMCVPFLSLQRDFKSGRSPAGVSNGHCSNGIVIGGPHGQTGNGGEKPSKISLPRRGSRSSKRQQQQQQQQPKKFFQAKFHEQERGISLEFGKFVALISISGELYYCAYLVYFIRSLTYTVRKIWVQIGLALRF